jgi:2-oxoisovalerate dehydrogenase E1 component
VRCDGTDPVASRIAMDERLAYVRTGSGPAIVHAECVRLGPHSNSDRHESYRSEEELAEARAKDPLLRFRAYLLQEGLISEEELKAIEAENKKAVDAAAQRAEAAPTPDPKSVYNFVSPEPFQTEETPTPSEGKREKLREAINRALHENFGATPILFVGTGMWPPATKAVCSTSPKECKGIRSGTRFQRAAGGRFYRGHGEWFCRFSKDIWVVIEVAQFIDYIWPAME